jgi:hypothetical protein
MFRPLSGSISAGSRRLPGGRLPRDAGFMAGPQVGKRKDD